MEQNRSPFYQDWEDQQEAARFQLHARELFDHFRLLQGASRAGHLDYGKWLIASLLAVHGGAIYAISGLTKEVAKGHMPDLVLAASWNISGILFILLAGFAAWLNFQFAESTYFRWANPAMLYRDDHFPKDEQRRTDPIRATVFLAGAFGLFSGYCFLASAITVVNAF